MIKKLFYIIILFLFIGLNQANEILIDSSFADIQNHDLTYLEVRLNEQQNIVNQLEEEYSIFLISYSYSDDPEFLIEKLKLERALQLETEIYITLMTQYEIQLINKYNTERKPEKFHSNLIPFNEQEELAKTYFNAGLYDDAIIIYNQIKNNTIDLFGENYTGLVQIYNQLANCYLLNNNLEDAKYFFQKSVNLQSSIIILEQNNYIHPFNILKQIYKLEENIDGVHYIDSLVNVLNTNTSIYANDSTLYLPSLIINNEEANQMLSEYTINDVAYDLIYEGYVYLENNLFSQAATNFIEAYNMYPPMFDLDYFLEINFINDEQIINLDNAMQDALKIDSTLFPTNFYSSLLNYKSENYELALSYIEDYLEKQNTDIVAWQLKGLIFIEQEEWENAIFSFSFARLLNEDNFYSNFYLGVSLLGFEEYNDANYIFKRALMVKPNHKKSNFYLGLSSLFSEDYKNAIKELKNALLLDSSNKDIYYFLGNAYKNNNQHKQALESFNTCISLDPKYSKAYYELGQIYEIIFEFDSAIQVYELTVQLIDDDDPISDELNYKLGILYYNNEQYKESMSYLREYALNNLNDYETLKILAEVFFNEGRYFEAIDIYNILLQEDSNNENFYYKIAESYYKIEEYQEALYFYKQVLIFNDENSNVLLNIGIIHNKMSQYLEAEHNIELAINCGFINKNLLVQLGIAYGGQKKYLQSMQAFKDALDFSLNDPIIHYKLGIIYQELNIHDLAAESIQIYINYNKKDYIGHYMLGVSYINLNKYNEAIESFQLALKYNKGHINSLYNIGLCYYNIENYKKSSQYLKTVLKKNPDHVLSRSTLIDVYIGQNKSREAKRECDIIYMLDRELYNIHPHCNN